MKKISASTAYAATSVSTSFPGSQELDAIEIGGALLADDRHEILEVVLLRQRAGSDGVQAAPEAFRADALGDHIVVIDVTLHAPVRQRGDAAAARDELEYGYRELGGAALEMNAGRVE